MTNSDDNPDGSPTSRHGDVDGRESGAEKVLIVEDNQPIARALAIVLNNAGYSAAVFHRGHDALVFARTNSFTAAVVDIHLPDTNGINVAQQLRIILGPKIPIVVLSADTSISTLNALDGAGATHFLSKPIKPAFLLEQLCYWIRESESPTPETG